MSDQTPRAFLSYAHFDDQRDGGRITNLREQLSGEVQMQTGKLFEIFQDVKDIQLGQSWQDRIDTALDEVTFLIPILTPSFFNSQACRDEVLRFLVHEGELGRNDLILPVYYVNHPPFNSHEGREGDQVADAMAAHQWIDWRDLRHESSTSATVGRILERMALQIRDALDRIAASDGSSVIEPRVSPDTGANGRGPSSPPPSTVRESPSDAQPTRGETEEGSRKTETRGPAKTAEPTTLVVDQSDGSQFTTIGEAIVAANSGDRIIVRPGVYHEGLLINKPLEIIGDGSVDEIVIEARGESALLFQATKGRVANLSLRQMGDGKYYCVDISQGRPGLENCDIRSHGHDGVAVHDGADPLIVHNRIHGCGGSGIYVYDNGKGIIADNDILDNGLPNVLIASGSDTTLRRNRIHGGASGGVLVNTNGKGTIEDNDIFGNARAGVAIAKGANPIVRCNRIHDGAGGGVFVYDNGEGTIEENDIFGDARAGVAIATGGNPTLRGNRIYGGQQDGVFVYENGEGTVEENAIFGNTYAGVTVKAGGKPAVRRNRVNWNGYAAVRVIEGGGGAFEDNDMRDNVLGAWDISSDSRDNVTRARNRLT